MDTWWTSTGSGVAVLALHGWTCDHRLMAGFLEPVFAQRPGFERIYPDLPGMGRTPAPAAVASSDDVLAAVLDLIDEVLGDRPFLLVGESYGGYLARAVVRLRRPRVAGLALVCPVGTVLERERRRRPPHRVLRAGDAPADDAFDLSAVDRSAEVYRRFRAEVRPGLELADEEALRRIERRWRLSEEPEDERPFDRPTLIVTGRQDSSVGYEDQFALLPHYPRATFAVLDVAGHNAQIEQPALCTALLTEWVDRVVAETPDPGA